MSLNSQTLRKYPMKKIEISKDTNFDPLIDKQLYDQTLAYIEHNKSYIIEDPNHKLTFNIKDLSIIFNILSVQSMLGNFKILYKNHILFEGCLILDNNPALKDFINLIIRYNKENEELVEEEFLNLTFDK